MMAEVDSAVQFHGVLVSSPGKVILHGEHAVVYGKTAIATSVDLRCYLLVLPTLSHSVTLELPDMQLSHTWSTHEITELLGSAEDEHLEVLKKFCGAVDPPSMHSLARLVLVYLLTQLVGGRLHSLPGLEVLVSSQLPFGAGLGSSAAYSVCIATALLASCGRIGRHEERVSRTEREDMIPVTLKDRMRDRGLSPEDVCRHCFCQLSEDELKLVNKWGLEAEKLVHGTPSGIDNSISVFGGAIKFRSGLFTQLERMPKLSILLVYTKVPRSTKKMVANVRQRHTTYPLITGPLLDSMENTVLKSETVLEQLHRLQCHDNTDTAAINQTYFSLQELFCINHHLLNAIGVGHPSLDRVQHIALEAGLGAKLTGAGGGGCAIVLLPPSMSNESITEVKCQMETAGYDCWLTNIGGNGITLHCCV